jgi:hypothetical protein
MWKKKRESTSEVNCVGVELLTTVIVNSYIFGIHRRVVRWKLTDVSEEPVLHLKGRRVRQT